MVMKNSGFLRFWENLMKLRMSFRLELLIFFPVQYTNDHTSKVKAFCACVETPRNFTFQDRKNSLGSIVLLVPFLWACNEAAP